MAEEPTPSVGERIERQTIADLVAAFGLDEDLVQRIDDENDPELPDGVVPELWITVEFEDEDELPHEDEAAAIGMETVDLPFTVHLHLLKRPASGGGITLSEWANRHIATAKAALMGNAQVRETDGGERIGHDTWIRRTFKPIRGDRPGEYVAGVEAMRRYRHPEGDPYTPA